MPTATVDKKQRSTVRKLCFYIQGDGATKLAREFWIEGRIRHTWNYMMDFHGMTKEIALLILTGFKKFEGDSRPEEGGLYLANEETPVTKVYGLSVFPADILNRLVLEWLNKCNYRLDIKRRLKFLGNSMNVDGANYRSGDDNGFYMKEDVKTLETLNEKILELEKDILFLAIDLMGKNDYSLPYEDVTGSPDFTDMQKAYYEPEEIKKKINIEEFDYDIVKRGYDKVEISSYIRPSENSENPLTRILNVDNIEEHYKKHDSPERRSRVIGSGWLFPDGTFFGDAGYAFIHLDIVYDLQKSGFFKDGKYGITSASAEENLEGIGCIKLSFGTWYWWHHNANMYPTPEQAAFMVKWAIKEGEHSLCINEGIEKVDLSIWMEEALKDHPKFDLYQMTKNSRK